MRALVAVIAFVIGWGASYLSGEWPWIGYASLTKSSFGAGPIAIIGRSSKGFDIGPSSFVFFRGQEIVVEYDAEIRSGSLWMHVFRPFDGTLGKGPSTYVSESGKGAWTVPVDATGYYHVTIEPSPLHGSGRGYDMTYSVRWGARPAGGG